MNVPAVDFFTNEQIRMFEEVYTANICKRLKKWPWADKLFSSDGSRKFTIVFARGTNLEFRAEVSTHIKLVILGLSVLPGGQAKVADIDTITRTISILQVASKHLQSTALTLNRRTILPGKRVVSGYELSEELLAIPVEESMIISTEIQLTYVVKDLTNGNVIKVTGTNEPAGAMFFNARVRLRGMRTEDD